MKSIKLIPQVSHPFGLGLKAIRPAFLISRWTVIRMEIRYQRRFIEIEPQ